MAQAGGVLEQCGGALGGTMVLPATPLRFACPSICSTPRGKRKKRAGQPLARTPVKRARPSGLAAPRKASVLGGETSSAVLKTPRLSTTKRATGKRSQTLSRRELREAFDGRVSETTHVEAHANCKNFCIRCDYQKRWRMYRARCSLPNGRSWLCSGVNRGLWGLGCSMCAQYASSGGRCANGRYSKFAKFNVRPTSRFQAWGLFEQHERSKSHRVACGLHRTRPFEGAAASRAGGDVARMPPDLPTEAAASGAPSCDDAALLQGNVPTAIEWRRAWATLSERVSLRKDGRVQDKEHSPEEAQANRIRKRLRKQLLVMAEVLRAQIRQDLRRATSISLAIDESKYRKVLRYRVDRPSASRGRHVGASGFNSSGVLGIIDCSKKHPEDFEDDHAVTAVKQMRSFITKFCTPLGRTPGRRGPQPLACDEALRDHIFSSVKIFAADGGSKERRAVFLAARELFPNLLIVIRDSAHAIRIAIKALHLDDAYGAVWDELFHKRHALVPDLQNSKKWENLFVAIQEEHHVQAVVALPGQPQPLAGIVRKLAFAKQRFDSTAGPVGKIALMLLPVATLLAYIASDRRHETKQRDRAGALLRKLDSKFCIATGVSADWGIICNWFLRLFDEANHDIAKSRSEIDCMIETLDAVFLEGRVFQNILGAPPTQPLARVPPAAEEPLPHFRGGVPGVDVGFITTTVMKNLCRKYIFYADGTPVLLWGEPRAAHATDLLHRLQNVASLAKERLQADFPRDDVRSALAIFDRRLVLKGFGRIPHVETRRFLLRGVRTLAALLGCEEAPAVLQYSGVLPYMLKNMETDQPLAEKTNQQAWATLLDDRVWEEACPNRLRSASGVLCSLIRFYISIEDGECTVERDLAEYRNQMLEHRTDANEFHDDCLVLRLNGPSSSAEFEGAASGAQSHARGSLTPFSRECAALWRTLYGSRRGHYNLAATAAAARKRKCKPGTFARASKATLAAARLAVIASRARKSASPDVAAGAGTADSCFWNEAMSDFQKRSQRNIPGVVQTRVAPQRPFINPSGVSLAARRAGQEQPLVRRLAYTKVAWLGVAPRELREECATVTGRHCAWEADLAVVPDLAFLHDLSGLSANAGTALAFLYVVSRGVDVTTLTLLAAAQYRPNHLQQRTCVRHVPALRSRTKFVLGARLVAEEPSVCVALRRLSRAPRSQFVVQQATVPAASGAAGSVFLNSLHDVVAWASSARRVLGEMGPKAVAVDGVPLPA